MFPLNQSPSVNPAESIGSVSTRLMFPLNQPPSVNPAESIGSVSTRLMFPLIQLSSGNWVDSTAHQPDCFNAVLNQSAVVQSV
jgi:hypothetical protein